MYLLQIMRKGMRKHKIEQIFRFIGQEVGIDQIEGRNVAKV